jgi:putative transposase
MPRKNSVKTYIEGACYHIYNRGVEKRKIFLDSQDYKVFLYFLKKYLQEEIESDNPFQKQKSLAGKIELLAYCLMSNHFHLLVKQNEIRGITKLMNRIGTNYGMYFNKRYQRVGSLFQGVYKAVLVEKDEQLLHVSRYIHLNPAKEGFLVEKLSSYGYSSYGDYLGKRETKWVKKEQILSFFNQKAGKNFNSYQSFVEGFKGENSFTKGLLLEG